MTALAHQLTDKGFAPRQRHDDRLRAHSREEVEAEHGEATLEDWLAQAQGQAARIEVDLEYRSAGDEVWEGRARGALTIWRASVTAIERRLRRLRGRATADPQVRAAQAYAKAEKQQASLGQAQLAAQRRREQLEAARETGAQAHAARLEKTRRLAIEAVRKVSWQGAFVQAAKARLDPALFADLVAAATSINEAAAREFLGELVCGGEGDAP